MYILNRLFCNSTVRPFSIWLNYELLTTFICFDYIIWLSFFSRFTRKSCGAVRHWAEWRSISQKRRKGELNTLNYPMYNENYERVSRDRKFFFFHVIKKPKNPSFDYLKMLKFDILIIDQSYASRYIQNSMRSLNITYILKNLFKD